MAHDLNITVNFMETEFYKKNLNKIISGKQINDETNNESFYVCDNVYPYEQRLSGSIHSDACYLTNKHNLSRHMRAGHNLKITKIHDDAQCRLLCDKIQCDNYVHVVTESIIGHEFFKDEQFCLSAVKHDCDLIMYVNKDILFANVSTCIDAIRQKYMMIMYIDKNILHDNPIMYTEAANTRNTMLSQYIKSFPNSDKNETEQFFIIQEHKYEDVAKENIRILQNIDPPNQNPIEQIRQRKIMVQLNDLVEQNEQIKQLIAYLSLFLGSIIYGKIMYYFWKNDEPLVCPSS